VKKRGEIAVLIKTVLVENVCIKKAFKYTQFITIL
jgi:hypothetical protein